MSDYSGCEHQWLEFFWPNLQLVVPCVPFQVTRTLRAAAPQAVQVVQHPSLLKPHLQAQAQAQARAAPLPPGSVVPAQLTTVVTAPGQQQQQQICINGKQYIVRRQV